MKDQPVTFELVLGHLRKRDFAVLSTINAESKPHSVGVTYGVSRPGRDVAIYVMTRKHRPFDQTAFVVSPTPHHPVARSSRDRRLD
jgi:hypothetical protein